MKVFTKERIASIKVQIKKIKDRIAKFMRNGALRRWFVMQLSFRTTWVQIFTFIATVTGAHLSAHNQDLISTIGVTICTIIGVASTNNHPDFQPPPCDPEAEDENEPPSSPSFQPPSSLPPSVGG